MSNAVNNVGNQLGTVKLPARPSTPLVCNQSQTLTTTHAPLVTSSALYQNIQLGLPTPSAACAGLWFTITHAGPRVTAIVDDQGFRRELTFHGEAVTVECDGTAWRADTGNRDQVAIWDKDKSQYRQAKSPQDVIDSLHALLGSVIEVMKDEGLNLSVELEDFYGSLGR